MDLRVTKERLNDHLSYDWWKYIAILVASIFFWSLIFTMTSPRLTSDKKMEVFFIVDGYDADGAERVHARLYDYLSQDFVDLSFNSYSASDEYTTSQVLTARISIREGDLYVFAYSDKAKENTFGVYVDRDLFVDFETLIADAKAFGADVMSEEQFNELNAGKREYRTPERLREGYQSYVRTRQRALAEAEKLERFIQMYGEAEGEPLFLRYSRNLVTRELFPEENLSLGEEKIWGLNFNAFAENISDFNNYGFIYSGVNPQTGSIYPIRYAMGFVSFKNENMPLYYENLAVINFFIETFYQPEIDRQAEGA